MKISMREFEQQYADVKDLIRLSVGQPGYPVSAEVLQAIASALTPLQPYPSSSGDPMLIAALAKRHAISAENLVLTHGASEAMSAALVAALQPRQRLGIAIPSYPAYFSLCEMLNIEPFFFPSLPLDFQPDLEALSKQNLDRIKALVLITGGNPTGQPLSAASLQRAAALCRQKDWTLILDASYAAFEPTLLSDPPCRFLHLGSFSKSHAMAGLRIGYCYGDPLLMKKVQRWVSLNSVAVASCIQKGALAALAQDPKPAVQQVLRQSAAFLKVLEEFHLPHAAQPGFYSYFDVTGLKMDALEFVDRCAREAQVLFLPGVFFGPKQETWVRACCAAERMTEALGRLRGFLTKYASFG